jgi:hypothetical protein
VTVGIEEIEDADSRRDQVMALVAELVELGCADPAVDCEVFRSCDWKGAGRKACNQARAIV